MSFHITHLFITALVHGAIVFLHTFQYTDLWNVDLRALGTWNHHSFEVVKFWQALLCTSSSFVTTVIQDAIHLVLKSLSQCVTRRWLKFIIVSFLNDFNHILLWNCNNSKNLFNFIETTKEIWTLSSVFDFAFNTMWEYIGCQNHLGLLCHSLDFFISFIVGNTVTDANTVTFNQSPVVHNGLNVAIKHSGNLMAKFNSNNMDQTSWRGSQRFLTQNARDQLTMFYQNLSTWKKRCYLLIMKIKENHK